MIIELIVGSLSSVVFFFLFLATFVFCEKVGFVIPFGGCKGIILFPLIFGVPLGASFGILILNKFRNKVMFSFWKVIILYFYGVFGVIFGVYLMDKAKNPFFPTYFTPLFSSICIIIMKKLTFNEPLTNKVRLCEERTTI